jgi:predicted acetylornithine/succinylornithine family transaminase
VATVEITDIETLERRHLLPVYSRPPVVFERGEGVRLFDRDGRAYLDFVSGVGVSALGHAHPRLAAALAEQAATLIHTSNLYRHPLQGELARRLADLAGLPRVFLCNSGTEAVEACLKFARRYWHARGEARPELVALEHAFHGRTCGSLSVTWEAHYREPFEPLLAGVRFVPPGDAAALEAAVTERTAAVIVEPIQGEGGVRPLPPAFARALAAACARTGALLVADEVQCGLGRTGVFCHARALGLEPDLVALGKALGGGMPIAAALFSERVAAAAAPGDHGSTYGGNALACRAALVVLDELTAHGLLDRVREAGAALEARLRAIAARRPAVRDVRGAGLMWGVELAFDAGPVVRAALGRGLLVNRTAGTVVRLLPPFIVGPADIEEACAILDEAIAAGAEAAA